MVLNSIMQASGMIKIFRGYFCPGGGMLTGSSILALLSLNDKTKMELPVNIPPPGQK